MNMHQQYHDNSVRYIPANTTDTQYLPYGYLEAIIGDCYNPPVYHEEVLLNISLPA